MKTAEILVDAADAAVNRLAWDSIVTGQPMTVMAVANRAEKLLRDAGLYRDKYRPILEMAVSRSMSGNRELKEAMRDVTYVDGKPVPVMCMAMERNVAEYEEECINRLKEAA